ncbi:hypothetical protein G6F57_018562 [Rhizopus arrhizus]|nr:hypothetical protein G6F57_018562 [Rhizopus arrhizus]
MRPAIAMATAWNEDTPASDFSPLTAEEQAGGQAHEDQCLAPDDAVDEMYGSFHARSLQSAGCKDVPSAGGDRSILPDRRPLR